MWSNYFATIYEIPEKNKDKITIIETKINESLKSKTGNSFNKLGFWITNLKSLYFPEIL